MNNSKLLGLLAAMFITLSIFSSCTKDDIDETKTTNIIIPKTNKNCWLFSTPKLFNFWYIKIKTTFVSITLGFDKTVIKGKIEATPIISNIAINKIITDNNTARLRSLELSKKNNFL